MPLPENFSAWEQLQKMISYNHNRLVREYFSDVGGEDWEPDLSSTRAQLRIASTITDDDTDVMVQLRLYLFYDILGYGKRDLAVIYGSRFNDVPYVAGIPQLFLVFSQDEASTPENEPPIQHEKSARLMKFACKSGESKPAITKANMVDYAREVKAQFISNKKGVTYRSGNKSASYTDPENGFPKGNYMLVDSKAEAVEIYSKLCNVIDISFKPEKLKVNSPDKSSTTSAQAGKITVLGKQIQNQRYRPIANLRFRYAYISLGALIPPVFLIDTTGRYKPLVEI